MTVQLHWMSRSTTSAVPATDTGGDWRNRSACRDVDPELFFPTGTDPRSQAQARRAKRVCGGCPVRAACLSWALDNKQDTGVWGGLDERERRELHGRPSAAQKAPRPSEWGTEIDEKAVERYLSGAESFVRPQERLEAVARGVRAGMAYPDFDRLHDLAKGATSTFMSRARKVCAAKGFDFPELGLRRGGARLLSDEQVLELREQYAAGGVTDLQLSMQVGVTRKTITELLSGNSYKDVGGPIRELRVNKPKESTRVLWAGSPGPAPVLDVAQAS
ncbi:WhiB family transcriptional regulator [Streptomyces sp. NPDC018055]|uniref:WhiB family transcriptional regulator n=1 Tax=Streptomyces sp. NPDC018055 TaxID=3365038 RepID=UPI0037AA70C7